LIDYLGGRGLGAKILFEEVNEKIAPLSPENKIIFVSGPLVGTNFPTSSRVVIVTKSPLTEAYLYSEAGSKLGINIKLAGFDAIIVEGKSDKRIFLEISDDQVFFRDAEYLWGMKTSLALYYLKNSLGKSCSVATIGPAGENMVKIACVISDDFRHFGRGGVGAVFGSKNLKAIAVRGTNKINVFDRIELNKNLKDIFALLKKQPGISKTFPRYGSGENLQARSAFGVLPTRNWTKCTFDNAWNISMMSMRDEKNMVVKDDGCFGCPLQCTKLTKSVSPDFPGYYCRGPEYETLYTFGSNCMISDPNFVVAANMCCDELGIDTMSSGIIIGFIMECMEKNILNKNNVNNYDLKFGKTDNVLDLLRDIAYKKGDGKLFSEGTKRIAKHLGKGSERFAMQVKGLEIGGYDPRTAKGQAVVFAAGNRGGCHHSIGLTAVYEVNNGIGQEISGKGLLVRKFARVRILFDSLLCCTFAFSRTFDYEIWSKILNSVTGYEFDKDVLINIADRINTLERMYNLREGFTVKDDILPARLMNDRLPDGPNKGEVVTEEQLEAMRSEYFNSLGWNKDGVPLKETVKKLDIKIK